MPGKMRTWIVEMPKKWEPSRCEICPLRQESSRLLEPICTEISTHCPLANAKLVICVSRDRDGSHSVKDLVFGSGYVEHNAKPVELYAVEVEAKP